MAAWQPNQAQQASLAGIGGNWNIGGESPTKQGVGHYGIPAGQGAPMGGNPFAGLPPASGGNPMFGPGGVDKLGNPITRAPQDPNMVQAGGPGQQNRLRWESSAGGMSLPFQQQQGPGNLGPDDDPWADREALSQRAAAFAQHRQNLEAQRSQYYGGGNQGLVRQPDGSYTVNGGAPIPKEAYWKFGLDASTAGPDGAKPFSPEQELQYGLRFDGRMGSWDTPGDDQQPPMPGIAFSHSSPDSMQGGEEMFGVQGGRPEDFGPGGRFNRGGFGGKFGPMGGLMGAPAMNRMRLPRLMPRMFEGSPVGFPYEMPQDNPFMDDTQQQGIRGQIARMLVSQF